MSLKSNIGRFLVQNLGWKTDEKIIVFESDDWGGIAMPDLNTYRELQAKGVRVEESAYLKYDSLASAEDLEMLLAVLAKAKNAEGKSPVFTLNTNPANPDFERIKADNFETYYFEKFTETLKRYPRHQDSFKLWQEGIREGYFEPQFHGREHLNTELWLQLLRDAENKHVMAGFEHNMYQLPKSSFPNDKRIINSAFYPNNEKEYHAMMQAIPSGLAIFKEIFGVSATSFIATGYFWHKDIEKTLAEHGITSIQGTPLQKQPDYKTGRIKQSLNYTGKRNRYNQINLVRNAFFEPSLNPSKDVVSDCLERIELSFKNKKPAIIGTHRLNYIGSLVPDNRDNNLDLLTDLLQRILSRWPEVQFLSSPQLATLIQKV